VVVLVYCAGTLVAVRGAEESTTPAEQTQQRRPPRIEDFAPPHEFVTVGTVKTHFVTRGDKGRPIVLIHGFGCSTSIWEKNLDELAKHFRVFALDVKGFGLTAKPRDGHYHLDAFSEHVLGFLDVMKVDRPVLVGNSMGGAIAARIALLHPDRVAGLVLVDAIPVAFPRPSITVGRGGDEQSPGGPDKPKLSRIPALARAMITRQTIAAALKSGFHKPELVTDAMIDTHYRTILFDGAPEALLAMLNPPPERAAPLPALASLTVPTLVTSGRFDRLVPQAVADYYARSIPGARQVVFENSGHFPQIEEAAEFNAQLAQFASQIP
jgi:pimeloyl-ACP methyl ester carboxylesterase